MGTLASLVRTSILGATGTTTRGAALAVARRGYASAANGDGNSNSNSNSNNGGPIGDPSAAATNSDTHWSDALKVRRVSEREALALVAADGPLRPEQLRQREVWLPVCGFTPAVIVAKGPSHSLEVPIHVEGPAFYHGTRFPRAHVGKVLANLDATALARLSMAPRRGDDWTGVGAGAGAIARLAAMGVESDADSVWLDSPITPPELCRRHLADSLVALVADELLAEEMGEAAEQLREPSPVVLAEAVKMALFVGAKAYGGLGEQGHFYRFGVHAVWGGKDHGADYLPALVPARAFVGHDPVVVPRVVVHPKESALRDERLKRASCTLLVPPVLGATAAMVAFGGGGVGGALLETWGWLGADWMGSLLQATKWMGGVGAGAGGLVTAHEAYTTRRFLQGLRHRMLEAELAIEKAAVDDAFKQKKKKVESLLKLLSDQEKAS